MYCGGCGGGAGSCIMVYINFKKLCNEHPDAYIALSPGKGGEGGSSNSNSGMNVTTIKGIEGRNGTDSIIRIHNFDSTLYSDGVVVTAGSGSGGKGGVANGESDNFTMNDNSSGGCGELNTTKSSVDGIDKYVCTVLDAQGGRGGYSNPYWTKNSKQYTYDLRGTTNKDKLNLYYPLNKSFTFPSFSKDHYQLGFNESYVSPFYSGGPSSGSNNYASASGGFNICNAAYYTEGSFVTRKMGFGYGGDGGNDGKGRSGNSGGFYILYDIDD